MTCESLQPPAVRARVSMSTAALTRDSRWLGWQAFDGTKTRYKKLEWAGTAEQSAYAFGSITSEECCRAKYVWAGASEITAAGVQISWYTKDLFTRAGDGRIVPYPYALIRSGDTEYTVAELIGYCWDLDPLSSPFCDSINLTPAGDVSTNSTTDNASGFSAGVEDPTVTDTTFIQTGTSVWDTLVGWVLAPSGPSGNFQPLTPIAPDGFPTYTLNEESGPWIHMTTDRNYTGTLSEEYTDAEALANSTTYNSNSAVARNFPRNLSSVLVEDWFRSSTTSVAYTLSCSNLVAGHNYIARVSLYRSDGLVTVVNTTFTALATTHTIVGAVPTPPANMTTTVRYPTILNA